MQVADQVQRVFQVSLLGLALLLQEVGQVEVPHQEKVLLFLGDVLARGDECRVDCLGAELQGPEQVLELPEVEDVFGDVLTPLGFGYVHDGSVFLFLRFGGRLVFRELWPGLLPYLPTVSAWRPRSLAGTPVRCPRAVRHRSDCFRFLLPSLSARPPPSCRRDSQVPSRMSRAGRSYLIQTLGSVRCLRKYCCDLSRLRDWSTMFFVSVRIVR